MSELYSVKWNDFNGHIGLFFANIFSSEQHSDVTLRAEGSSFKCHRLVLSASSPYFHGLLESTDSQHPVIIIAGVEAEDIEIIIDFMYHGEMKNINYERFISVLKTAEMLKINGLTEVTIFQSASHSFEDSTETFEPENIILNEPEKMVITDPSQSPVNEISIKTEYSKSSSSVPEEVSEKNKKIKDFKKYSEGNIDRALKDMEWGMTLMEAARLHNIPRSTLYSKAKHHSGLQIMSRKEHSNQDCHPALQAIADGMSLKRAAEEFNIPKTVLWRRVQKRLDILSKVKCRKKRGCKQLKDSEDHLSDPFETSSINTAESESTGDDENTPLQDENRKSLKKIRLSQAVEACKMGKMSQATASTTFQVPKTTIWRRLQKCSAQEETRPQIIIEKKDHHYAIPDDYGEYDLDSEKCSTTNIDDFKSSALVVKPVFFISPNNYDDTESKNSTYENCVELSCEENDCLP